LEFPRLGSRPTVDVLIDLDCTDLHCSLKDIHEGPGQSVAHLTPLGWICISNLGNSKQPSTNFAYTYFSTDQQDMEKINLMLQRLRETENIAIENVPVFKVDEKAALDFGCSRGVYYIQ